MIQLEKNTENLTGGQEPEDKKYTESEQSQTYALEKENKSKSGNEIAEKEKIEKTPFDIITITEEVEGKKIQVSFIAVGNKRITEITTYVKCLQMIQERDWNLMVSLITIITEAVTKEVLKEEAKQWQNKEGLSTLGQLPIKQNNVMEDVKENK